MLSLSVYNQKLMAKKSTTKLAAQKSDSTINLLDAIVEAMLERKAKNIVSLNLSKLDNPISKYFVICNADSTTQVEAIAEHVEDSVRERLGERVFRRDGVQNALWILLDYSDVMVHIFQTECRDFYKLEDLWADAERKTYADEKG